MGIHSFASSAATLPASVAEQIAIDVRSYGANGRSVLELPFTGPEFTEILNKAERQFRKLLPISDDYHVLFLQGGASSHFTLIPMNLLGDQSVADYVETGLWSHRAIAGAKPWASVNIAGRGDTAAMPHHSDWQLSPGSAYCHVTSNETAEGLQYFDWPTQLDIPLVADMTADLLTRPIAVDRFGLIYASAQKNLCASGLTIVIVRQDLLQRTRRGTPPPLDYSKQVAAHSKVNTPATFALSVAVRMLDWIEAQGGLSAMQEINRKKSDTIYAVIDASGFYRSRVEAPHRSMLNVCFKLATPELEALFLSEAEAEGLIDLSGHTAIGGIRASLYNTVPQKSVSILAEFMRRFELRRG